jgi:hypothetical protein
MLAPLDPRLIVATARKAEAARAGREQWFQTTALLLACFALLAGVSGLGFIRHLSPVITSLFAIVFWLGALAWLVLRLRGNRQMSAHDLRQRLLARYGADFANAVDVLADRPSSQTPDANALWAVQTQRAASIVNATYSARRSRGLRRPTRSEALCALALIVMSFAWLVAPKATSQLFDVNLSALAGDAPLVIDAWATPPEGFGIATIKMPLDGRTQSLHKGSKVTIRVDGAKASPTLKFAGTSIRLQASGAHVWSAEVIIDQAGTLTLNRLGERGRWPIKLTPDYAPDAQLLAEPTIDATGKLRLKWASSDNFGIASVGVRLRARTPPPGLAARPIVDVAFALTEKGSRALRGTTPIDLRAHAFAGLDTEIRLLVRDSAGNTTVSRPFSLALPRYQFKTPQARAIDEQHRTLVQEARPYAQRAARLLLVFDRLQGQRFWDENRLRGAPDGVVRTVALIQAFQFAEPDQAPKIVLGLAAALGQIKSARQINEAQRAAPLLWEIALALDRGEQTEAEQELNAAKENLKNALQNGAGEDELRDAIERLKAALGARLSELAETGDQAAPSDNAETLAPSDLEELMHALNESAQSGARGEALALLDRLDEILQNLSVSPGSAQAGGGQGSGSSGPLDELAKQQQELADETLRAQNQNEEAPSETDPAKSGSSGIGQGLAERQEQLRQQLGQTEGAGEAGQDAVQAMENAAKALREGDFQGALEAQDRALGSLRAAADAAKGGQSTDPLGRGLGNAGRDAGSGTHVPDAPERRRSREVLDEVRRRASEPQRPPEERNYLERLLDRFSAGDPQN